MSLDLLEKIGENRIKARTLFVFNAFVRLWKEHVGETLESLLGSYEIGLETGDIEHAAHSLFYYSSFSYFIGKPLFSLEQEMARYSHAIDRLKQESSLNNNNLFWQTILNLMGHSDNPCCLSRKVYDENIQLERYQQTNDRTAMHYLHLNKCILHYLFQKYAVAVENIEIAEQHLEGVTGSLTVAIFHFYDSLARLALYSSLHQQEQDAVLTKVSANQKKMKLWAEHAPMNFQHKYDLVEAERCRVLEQYADAREFYDKAIALAHENEYLNEEALAYELAGQFYTQEGQTKFAQVCLYEAHYAYQQWGALAKVKDLEERYPQFLSTKKARVLLMDGSLSTTGMPSTSTSLFEWLDLKSIMKAAQTLSGEMFLGSLLEKMMHIVIENPGAERGFLLLYQQEDWLNQAQYQVDRHDVQVLQSSPIENQPIAKTIIQYVERSQEYVVLHNATQEGQFTRDPYIIEQGPKSILCTPLLNKRKLTGILYLENNLTEGAFTEEHLQVLKMLSSQIAISIENALLYQTLEEKVEERTAQLAQRTEELAQANEAITGLNEQLKSENLRMSAELEVSRQLQQMLLPTEQELQQIDGLDIAGFMEPADEVGGDYYDVLQHNGRVLFGIGDVTGHGLESGALTIMVQSSLSSLLAYDQTEPVRFLNALNQMVFHNMARMNVQKSLSLSLLSYQAGELLLTGQHEEMILVRQGELELIDTLDLGFQIGLEPDITDFVAQTKVSLNQGDVVVLYTDGITEAENRHGEMYQQERLCHVIQQYWQKTASEIREHVIDDILQFIGVQKVYDDITLLILKQK